MNVEQDILVIFFGVEEEAIASRFCFIDQRKFEAAKWKFVFLLIGLLQTDIAFTHGCFGFDQLCLVHIHSLWIL